MFPQKDGIRKDRGNGPNLKLQCSLTILFKTNGYHFLNIHLFIYLKLPYTIDKY